MYKIMSILKRLIILLSLSSYISTNAQLFDLINDELASDKCSEYKCQQCEASQIRCEMLNLTSLELIQDASSDISSIRFSGNRLVSINNTIFNQNMTSLVSLDLSDNQIEFINETSFLNLPVLGRLILDSNRIDPNRIETLKSFTSITNTLKVLSLVNGLKAVNNKPESTVLEDIKLHSLLKLTSNLRTLKLSNNSLQVFNVDNTVDFQNLTDQDQNYEDILCLIPGLEHLYLDSNKLSELKFELSCINQNPAFSLTSLHLESNQFSNVDLNLIKAFKRMKGKNSLFRVYLASNPFRCDCQIYEFYKFLVSNESDGIVEDKSTLMCTHQDSINTTYWKRIVNARIDRICGFGGANQTTSTNRYTYVFPTRRSTTTTKSTSTRSKEPLHSNHKLIIFMFASLMISGVIAFILRIHCFKMFRFSQMSWYKSLSSSNNPSNNPPPAATNGENFTATSVVNGGAPEYLFNKDQQRIILNPIDADNSNNELQQQQQEQAAPKKMTILYQMGTRLGFLKKSKERVRTVIVSQPMMTMSQSSLAYDQLDDESATTSQQQQHVRQQAKAKSQLSSLNATVQNTKNKLKLKNIVSSSDESDKEDILADNDEDSAQNQDRVYLDLSPKVVANTRP